MEFSTQQAVSKEHDDESDGSTSTQVYAYAAIFRTTQLLITISIILR